MRKTLISLLVFAAVTLQAEVIAPDVALARIKEGTGKLPAKGTQSPSLKHTFYDADGIPAVYLFTYAGNEGFILVSADNIVAPLLGYSTMGEFGTDGNCPTSAEAWVTGYVEQIEYARNLPGYSRTVNLTTRANEDWAEIKPMLTTQWDQTYPYNIYCPVVGNRRTAAGCVATSMAQVMKYWEYPSVGQSSITYFASNIEETLTLDFSAQPFEWSNMLDVYYGNQYDIEQAWAVGYLLEACGYSVQMNYSIDASGTLDTYVPGAFTRYFGYDQDVVRRTRAGYTQEAWNSMIYNQLATVGPVIYGGQSGANGHSFVCDGYDGNGMFHINWGWSGISDGYFLLDDLTPSVVGTGGNKGGYNYNQSAIINIMPPVGRLSVVSLEIANKASDSGNVQGQGYINRINDFSDIEINLSVRVSGGHITSPIFVKIYETDPATMRNGDLVYESQFRETLNAGDGTLATYTDRVDFQGYDPGKLYTITLLYNLKGQLTTIGTLRVAAGAGVDDVYDDDEAVEMYSLNGIKVSEPLTPGFYITVSASGVVRKIFVK